MIEIGDRVKINFDSLMEDSLEVDRTTTHKDYLTYLKTDRDKVYVVSGIDEKLLRGCPYILDDDYLVTTTFAEDELIKV